MRSRFLFTIMIAACWLGVGGRSIEAIEFSDLLSSLDVLETVAGNGATDSPPDWLPTMEGGSALAADLSRPHMATSDWAGNIYIADKDAHAIRKVTPDGKIVTIAGTNVAGFNGDGPGTTQQLAEPNGLFTFPNGVHYIVDLGNNRIRRLSPDGHLTTVLEDPLGIDLGRGLWVSPDQQTIFYSSGSQVRRWTSSLGLSTYASGFSQLANLDVDPSDGELVVTDRGLHGVYKVFADGTRTLIAGNESTFGGGSGFPATDTALFEVRGIQFHPDGGMLLATHSGGQVWFVDDQQKIHLLIDGDDNDAHGGDGEPVTTPGLKVSEVRAVALGANGDLLVTEHDNGYIRRVKTLQPFLKGDFNRDRRLDALDMDLLSESVRAQSHLQTLDLTLDEVVDRADLYDWATNLFGTSIGDANLDRAFTSQDFVHVFQIGEYEDGIARNSTWSDGDWDGDGDFTSTDFVAAFQVCAYEMETNCNDTPPRPAESVPEPIAVSVGSLVAVAFALRRYATTSPPGKA